MLKSISFFVGLRYTRAQKKSHFVSFISLMSMLGIAIGVMVLITVLSVMNGFDEQIHHRFFDMAPELTITSVDDKLSDWQTLRDRILNHSEVKACAPYVGGQGLLTHEGRVFPIIISGILPEFEKTFTHLDDKLIAGDMSALNHFNILLGRTLAQNAGSLIDDKVTIMVPKATMSITGMLPRFKRFTLKGVFSAGNGFNFDSKLGFIHLSDAQKLFQLAPDTISGLKIKISEVYKAPELAAVLQKELGDYYVVGNWTQQFGAFFQAIKMEKTMMFLILTLIIAVAAFNLVSSLVMIVNDKQSEIAILRTMGASPRMILKIFMVQGMLIGLVGVILGLIGGLLLASNATAIVNGLQTLLNIKLFSANIYFVDYLPSKILFSDIMSICMIALFMCFLATIYPAYKASKTIIAEALHYE